MKLTLRTKLFIKKVCLSTALFLVFGCSLNVPEKHFKLGEEYFLQGQFKRSVEEYSKVIEIEPKKRMALTALDRIAEIQRNKLKDPANAIVALRRKFNLSNEADSKIGTLRLIADIYREDLEDPRKAAEEYQKIYNEFGLETNDADQIILNFAEVLKEAQMFSSAAIRYQEFLTKFPGHKLGPRAMLNMGTALLSAGNLDKAQQELKKVNDQFSGRAEYDSLVAESLFAMGNLFEEKDDLDRAIELYKLASQAYPNPAVVELKIKALEKRRKERNL
ncbi:tetratricopeptide repeat protein [bacterium]|nr:tetratricopeptide repeat protein [bacterium]